MVLSNQIVTFGSVLHNSSWPQKQGKLFPWAELFICCFLLLRRRRSERGVKKGKGGKEKKGEEEKKREK